MSAVLAGKIQDAFILANSIKAVVGHAFQHQWRGDHQHSCEQSARVRSLLQAQDVGDDPVDLISREDELGIAR